MFAILNLHAFNSSTTSSFVLSMYILIIYVFGWCLCFDVCSSFILFSIPKFLCLLFILYRTSCDMQISLSYHEYSNFPSYCLLFLQPLFPVLFSFLIEFLLFLYYYFQIFPLLHPIPSSSLFWPIYLVPFVLFHFWFLCHYIYVFTQSLSLYPCVYTIFVTTA